MTDAPLDAAGHRARLRRRLVEHGGDALADHELVELLLALAIPRRDVKPLAKALLREFGGLAKLLSAPPEALMRVPGMGEAAAAAIRLADAAALRLLRVRASEGPVLSSWQTLLDYLHADMAHLGIERVRVLYLDTRNRLMRDEVAAEGWIDQAPVYVAKVMRRALELGAASMILVHNHPSGDPSPSKQDIQLTRELMAAAGHHRVAVHDHVIVGAHGHASMKALGLI